MAVKKEVHRKPVKKENAWDRAKKKLQQSTYFVKKEQYELLQLFQSAQTGMKVFVTAIIIGFFIFGVISVARSLSSISEKQKAIEEIDRQIKIQQEENENLDNKMKGNMDEIMERLARERLDMVYPDEETYVNKAG